jgi:hypothetical protein
MFLNFYVRYLEFYLFPFPIFYRRDISRNPSIIFSLLEPLENS